MQDKIKSFNAAFVDFFLCEHNAPAVFCRGFPFPERFRHGLSDHVFQVKRLPQIDFRARFQLYARKK